MPDHSQEADNPLQGYYDWQVNTLMLAYDLHTPMKHGDEEAHRRRRSSVEDEVRELTLAVVPDLYKNDPSLNWPPDVMMDITRATLLRAAHLSGIAQ